MGEKSSKKRTVAGVCQNILMICGVITALTGALGGVVETVKNVFDGDDKAAVASVAPAPASESIVIEQRMVGGAGKVRISKSLEVGDTAESDAEGSAESGTGEAEPTFGDVVTMSAAPEETLGQMWKRLWGWMLGIGISVVAIIISVNVIKRKTHETNGS